jgi:hypothetical protein
MKILLSGRWNSGQNRDIKLANRATETVSQFREFGMTVTSQNLVQGEIKGRLNSGNAWYHSVQNLLSSRILCKDFVSNIKVET